MSLENYLIGRKLLKEEIPKIYQKKLNSSKITVEPGIKEKGNFLICNRCGLNSLKKDCHIKNKKRTIYYCPHCLLLGRVDSNKNLYSMKEKKGVKRPIEFVWKGKLTNEQEKISLNLVNCLKTKEHQLVHAVTGAGKTEMLFLLIKEALLSGMKIAVVSPRVDVCLEIYPRFQNVFPNEEINLLYGRHKEEYRYSKFVVATTHQMLRFFQSFDLIIVDEVDAFPYANNPVLTNAVKRALRKEGVLVYLTATPSKDLQEEVRSQQLVLNSLPKRYHGKPLPVPVCYFDYFLNQRLAKNKLSPFLIKELNKEKKQCLIFFSNINRMKKCFCLLRKRYPEKRMAYVYAGKEDREELIFKMRGGDIDWLLTTTILERGVTFPNIDVIVYEADHQVFNTASLVQISGRVGRKAEYPTGKIIFIHKGKTKSINEAIKQIKLMNQEAGFE
jgi:competence protein ComFA